ncbi:MAG TPA: RNA polymerase sigma-54 factor [Acidobacteriaceae bacterium]|nr:RNA polymerase sigma-54 factor [Acidobacteriaceae bacterium]
MVLLQPKLSLKVAQRQILTPGLMQMVSVLALNKLELREMIQAEIAENPVLEEMDENVPLLDDVAREEESRDRPVETQTVTTEAEAKEKDPFDEIDFGSYFQDYLDPGFRSPNNYEEIEKPSIENFLSAPATLSDHLFWQLGALSLSPAVREAAEYIIGNLNEDGYMTAADDELLAGYLREQLEPESSTDSAKDVYARVAELPVAMTERARAILTTALDVVQHLDPVGIGTRDLRECLLVQVEAQRKEFQLILEKTAAANRAAVANGSAAVHRSAGRNGIAHHDAVRHEPTHQGGAQQGIAQPGVAHPDAETAPATGSDGTSGNEASTYGTIPNGTHAGASVIASAANGNGTKAAGESGGSRMEIFDVATRIIDTHMLLLQKRDPREVSKAVGKSVEETQRAIDFIRTLDPRPGQRYNRSEARLIEPDVAFVKRGEEWMVAMNEEDLPTLRLNQGYRRLLTQGGAEKDVKDYVKERYRSALQLMRNIEQRKNTILRTCESIVRRQTEFLEKGVDALKPMMIKEVAEEIGVHPSTVSRAVSSKYVHTPQGVYELRFFFSEGVNGPEGAGTPLMLLKRKVKKLIEDEDPRKPLTDDQIASLLQQQGIDVTRRTVAKYREDLRIPSTHQRRVRG